jgi:hypothetical protein
MCQRDSIPISRDHAFDVASKVKKSWVVIGLSFLITTNAYADGSDGLPKPSQKEFEACYSKCMFEGKINYSRLFAIVHFLLMKRQGLLH